MSNIILKISDGELFNFFDSEEKKEFTVGSKRTCDVVVKGFFVAPEQLRFIQKNNVWYVEWLWQSMEIVVYQVKAVLPMFWKV